LNIISDAAISEIMQFLRRILKAIQKYSYELSKKYGINGAQLRVLKIIPINGSLSLKDLGERIFLHPSTITRLINVLETKRYAVRIRDQEDGRVVKVQLTPEGERLVKKAPNPARWIMIYGLKKLKKRELNLICDSVQKLAEIMEAKNVEATFFFDK
jgi:DNA-binding MarR family transcriptional regulator